MADLHLERTVAGTAAVVWRYFTDGARFASWYGPTGAAIDVSEMQATPGGVRHFSMSMTTPDGDMTMWFCGEFKELNPPNRLVYTEAMCDEAGTVADPDSITDVIVELADNGDGTTALALTHVGVPEDSPGAMGWNMALDKLVAAATS